MKVCEFAALGLWFPADNPSIYSFIYAIALEGYIKIDFSLNSHHECWKLWRDRLMLPTNCDAVMPTKALLPRLWLCMSQARILIVLKKVLPKFQAAICFLESCGFRRLTDTFLCSVDKWWTHKKCCLKNLKGRDCCDDQGLKGLITLTL